jgi:hypothetical protein
MTNENKKRTEKVRFGVSEALGDDAFLTQGFEGKLSYHPPDTIDS